MKRNFMNVRNIVALIAITTALSTGCKKDDNNPQNESENITTVTLTLTPSNVLLPTIIASFKDLDGDGPNPPVYDGELRFIKDIDYECQLTILDETKTPADTISKEILNEANDHQFFYKPTGIPITIIYSDMDSKGLPLGLKTFWEIPSNPGTGDVSIILKHQPGIKKGSQDDGDTDIEVSFPITVE